MKDNEQENNPSLRQPEINNPPPSFVAHETNKYPTLVCANNP